ncbi:hypothetical protein LV779_27590 [Streptomyces thinghirensis]|nr:hypothetical protein [Streptomyces thinghirensis]
MELLSPLFDARRVSGGGLRDGRGGPGAGSTPTWRRGLRITPETRERLRERMLD